MVKNPSAETQSAFLAFKVTILNENFDTYEIPRFSWLPKIETVLVDNPEMPPQGCGEPAITTMGGVIANAVYDAIGVRLYVLPMTPARIKEAREKPEERAQGVLFEHIAPLRLFYPDDDLKLNER